MQLLEGVAASVSAPESVPLSVSRSVTRASSTRRSDSKSTTSTTSSESASEDVDVDIGIGHEDSVRPMSRIRWEEQQHPAQGGVGKTGVRYNHLRDNRDAF